MNKSIFGVIIICCVICSSCVLKDFEPDKWAIEPQLELSSSGVVLSSIDEEYSFKVKTNYQEFMVETNQRDWCFPIADVDSGIVHVRVSKNDNAQQRVANVIVTIKRGAQSLSKTMTIYQVGGKWDIVKGTDIRLRWSYDVSESQMEIIKDQIRQLVHIDKGTFYMGAQNEDETSINYFWAADSDNPVHQVTLSEYYIGKYEVTQEQWAAVMGYSPSRFVGGNKPVENITWQEAMEYAMRLSELTGLTFSLPTSAQWEYAARGGKYSMGYSYAGSNDLDSVAHTITVFTSDMSPLYTTANVGNLKPNELGLYDMSGNVAEFCLDWAGAIPAMPAEDPMGPSSGKFYVERGGSFVDGDIECSVYWCSSFTTSADIKNKESFTGLRLVLKQSHE